MLCSPSFSVDMFSLPLPTRRPQHLSRLRADLVQLVVPASWRGAQRACPCPGVRRAGVLDGHVSCDVEFGFRR